MPIIIKRKSQEKIGVPTASLPDIIFLLLIFFMVTTVLREYTGLSVLLPETKKIKKMDNKRHITTIWIDRNNRIVIDGTTVKSLPDLRKLVIKKVREDSRLVVSLKADKSAGMGIVADVQQELRKAQALRVNYSTLKKL